MPKDKSVEVVLLVFVFFLMATSGALPTQQVLQFLDENGKVAVQFAAFLLVLKYLKGGQE